MKNALLVKTNAFRPTIDDIIHGDCEMNYVEMTTIAFNIVDSPLEAPQPCLSNH